MKTNSQNQNDQRQDSESEQKHRMENTGASWAESKQHSRISFERRSRNRKLGTEQLLKMLQTSAPRFFELAEVVGKWVWIEFEKPQPSSITRFLSELGFQWNKRRQLWQHPCGTLPQRKAVDPRSKYGSYFAADQKSA